MEIEAGRKYVRIIGCDDTTEIPAAEFNESQLVTLEFLAKKSEKYSESGCQPTVRISKAIEKSRSIGGTYLGWDDDE